MRYHYLLLINPETEESCIGNPSCIFYIFIQVLVFLSQMTQASQIKLQNTIDRIAGAILSGTNLNPPPTRNIKWPCIICNRPVQTNQKAIECDTCHKWCHINCDGRVTTQEYEFYMQNQDNTDIKWHCLCCSLKEKHGMFPFTLSDNSELFKINNSDTMEFCKTIPALEIIQETSSYVFIVFIT